jgi:hypothetical protein
MNNQPVRLVWLLLVRPDDRGAPAFEGGVARLADEDPHVVACHLRTNTDPAAGTAHGRAMAGGPDAFDAVLELDPQALGSLAEHTLKDLRERIAGLADHKRSTALAGTAYVFAPGPGRFMNAFWIRPARGLSIAASQERWLYGHRAALDNMVARSGSIRPLGSYAQVHTDEAASQALAGALALPPTDLAGAARSFTDDTAAIGARLARREIAEVALADERAFIDHARSAMALYRRLTEAL